MNVKRNRVIYLIYLIAISTILFRLYFSIADRSFLLELVLVLGFLFCIAVLAWLIINPNYIELKDDKMILCRDFFYKDSFLANEITSVKLRASPLEKSHFVLRSGVKIEFNYFYVSDKDFNKVVDYLKIEIQ